MVEAGKLVQHEVNNIRQKIGKLFMATAGLDPATFRVLGGCDNQLHQATIRHKEVAIIIYAHFSFYLT